MLELSTRITHKGEPFEVDAVGSAYITHLHNQLEIARSLAKEVDALNSNCNSIGAGYMAQMKTLAEKLLQ